MQHIVCIIVSLSIVFIFSGAVLGPQSPKICLLRNSIFTNIISSTLFCKFLQKLHAKISTVQNSLFNSISFSDTFAVHKYEDRATHLSSIVLILDCDFHNHRTKHLPQSKQSFRCTTFTPTTPSLAQHNNVV